MTIRRPAPGLTRGQVCGYGKSRFVVLPQPPSDRGGELDEAPVWQRDGSHRRTRHVWGRLSGPSASLLECAHAWDTNAGAVLLSRNCLARHGGRPEAAEWACMR